MKRVDLPDDAEVEDEAPVEEEDDPNDQTNLGVYKRLAAQAFLLFENDESGPAAFYLGLGIKLIIIFAILAYIFSTIPMFMAPPDPCTADMAVCNNDPDLCPGTTICAPKPFPIFDYIETFCVAFFSFDYVLRASTCWSVNAKNAGVLPPGWEERNLTAKVKVRKERNTTNTSTTTSTTTTTTTTTDLKEILLLPYLSILALTQPLTQSTFNLLLHPFIAH